MQATFVLIDLFCLNISCRAIVRQTLQTLSSPGMKLRNDDPEDSPQVLANVLGKFAKINIEMVNAEFIFY